MIQEVQAQNLAGTVTVYLTYDTDSSELDPDLDAYRVAHDLPVGVTVRVNILRAKTGRIWHTTVLSGQGEWADVGPFGSVKKVADVQFELVGI